MTDDTPTQADIEKAVEWKRWLGELSNDLPELQDCANRLLRELGVEVGE